MGAEFFCFVGQANLLEAPTSNDNPVIEAHVGNAGAQFVDFKSARRFIADIEAVAVARRSQENVILDTAIHGLRKDWLKSDHG